MKYKLNNDRTYQIVGKTYTENGITYTISSTATQEQLEDIGVFEVQKKPLQDGFQYSNDTELVDGVVYYKQILIPIIPPQYNSSLIKKRVWGTFKTNRNVMELLKYQYNIDQNIDSRNYPMLHSVTSAFKSIGLVNDEELQIFRNIFLEYGIDITTEPQPFDPLSQI